ncbi:MAG: hypothetical protein ACTSWE_15255 [Promethearchaeota archaeon]
MKIGKKLKNNFYIIFPCICSLIWGFYYLIFKNFIIYNRYWDFQIFYFAGQQVLLNPAELYSVPHYFYLPSFGFFFALYVFIFPYILAYYISFFANLIFTIFFIREFNKILILLKVRVKYLRFIFLLLISNSWFLYFIYTFSQTKIFVGLIILYILRRELQFQELTNLKSRKFYFINDFLFIFAIGMAPPLILLFFIYFFHGIQKNSFLNKKQLERYVIAFLIFFGQNFLFIIYPELLLTFIHGFTWTSSHEETRCCYLYLNPLPVLQNDLFIMISTLILFMATLWLLFNNKISLSNKIGYFSVFYLYFGMYNCFALMHLLISFSLFAFISYLNLHENLKIFLASNKLILLSLSSIAFINLMPPEETILRYMPIFQYFPFFELMSLRYVIFFMIFGFTFLFIKMRYKKDE